MSTAILYSYYSDSKVTLKIIEKKKFSLLRLNGNIFEIISESDAVCFCNQNGFKYFQPLKWKR